jgi:hypothetical protein
MKTMFCWRCQRDMPMLDEEEFREIDALHYQGSRRPGLPVEERFRPLLQRYLEMTGFEKTNPLAVLHHRISLYGQTCENCGKPLRTSEATFCAECGKTA